MDTIRNYLESMFANLPNTPEVLKAKNELGQMMEDKYTELKAEGKTDNEAIGTVIAEFGNLDEIADDLGIQNVLKDGPQDTRRPVTLSDAKAYLADQAKSASWTALGVLLCILSSVPLILLSGIIDQTGRGEDPLTVIGVCLLLLMIACGVGLFIYTGSRMKDWEYLKHEPCSLDYGTAQYVADLQHAYEPTRTMLVIIGVILCISSAIPAIVLGTLFDNEITDSLAGAFVLILVAIGVYLFVSAGVRSDGFQILLHLNAAGTIGGGYARGDGYGNRRNEDNIRWDNPVVSVIMSVYWPTITCIYLCWSFLTFQWWLTWIVWPIASVIYTLIKNIFGKRE